MSVVVTLKINDIDVSGQEDETILDVAREHDIYIPTMCHLDGLSSVGACRLCLVEVKGMNRLVTACTVKVAEGMEVYTETERLKKYRRMLVEMLFSEGNHICSVCVVNGRCELQSMAGRVGVQHITLPYYNPLRTLDTTHERFVIDRNRCILCTRCVRVCDEIEGAHTWDLGGRGIESHVVTDLNTFWGDSPTCTGCSKCVHVCPTGALFEKGRSVTEMTKHREFLPYLTMMREKK
ncbi:MAG: bidirectional hydrogenase complex protein HoxU [Chloroflexi bacterium]|nr:bidirectional hydrogenase complex protein HoxU [Chloroflexota bacterium]